MFQAKATTRSLDGRGLPAVIAVLLALLLPGQVLALEKEDHQRISNIARDYIAARNPWRNMKTRIEVDTLDPRTQLARCPIKPEAFLPSGARIKRRTTVGVRCPGAQPWKIYLPVRIAAYARVMVATHPIAPGATIAESDVSWSERDISTLSYGYLQSLDGRGGFRAKRAIAQGAVLSPSMVEADSVIDKGQRVELVSQAGGIAVSMTGIALQEGAIGKRILVKNLSSGKQLEGVVQSSSQVVF